MRTLTDHVLLYDEDCPLCRVYTQGFVKAGMLDARGRQSYKRLDSIPVEQLDMKRALSEIALVDRRDGSVIYGVESLLKILGHRFSFFRWYGRQKPLMWLARKAYSFISSNRKVIAPSRLSAMEPPLNKKYRIAYLLFGSLLTGLILFGYARLLEPVLPAADARRELLICVGQIAWQTGVLYGLKSPRKWDYLGNMITVSLMGGLGLLPLSLISTWVDVPVWLALGYFGVVVGCMLLEHMRRVRLLELNPILSLSWIGYRVFALLFIIGLYLISYGAALTFFH